MPSKVRASDGMSAWRGRELPVEPLAGALAQLSQIATSVGRAHTPPAPLAECLKVHSPTPFAECLQHLQALHEEQVASLTGEAVLLRKEVDALRREAQIIVDPAMVPCKEVPLMVDGDCNKRGLLRETSEPAPEEVLKSARDPSKDTVVKGLSPAVSRNIVHHLQQFRSGSERSVAVARTASAGSVLLDEYVACRKLSAGGEDSDRCVSKVVSSANFDVCIGAIIAMNAVTIGLETSMNRAGQEIPPALHISEYVFLFVYTVEIALRFGALRRRALCNAWVMFDFLLVCCGFFDVTATFLFGPPVELLGNVMLVRTLRLARLARVLRLMVRFRTLCLLVQGLLNSLMTLVWTCIIICILLFVFAVLGLELLQPDPLASEEYNKVASEHFGSLIKAIISLLQGLTLDSFGVIYRPVMLAKPLTVFYFVPFLMVVSIALMNLVTALMVNFSLEQAAKDRQADEQAYSRQKAEVVRILEAAFRELDTGRSGRIDLADMLAAPEELRTLICEVADVGTDEGDLVYVFRTLDFEKRGYVKIEDFCQGLLMFHDQRALESYFIRSLFCSTAKSLRRRRSSEDPGRRSSVMGTVSSQHTALTLEGDSSPSPWM